MKIPRLALETIILVIYYLLPNCPIYPILTEKSFQILSFSFLFFQFSINFLFIYSFIDGRKAIEVFEIEARTTALLVRVCVASNLALL